MSWYNPTLRNTMQTRICTNLEQSPRNILKLKKKVSKRGISISIYFLKSPKNLHLYVNLKGNSKNMGKTSDSQSPLTFREGKTECMIACKMKELRGVGMKVFI